MELGHRILALKHPQALTSDEIAPLRSCALFGKSLASQALKERADQLLLLCDPPASPAPQEPITQPNLEPQIKDDDLIFMNVKEAAKAHQLCATPPILTRVATELYNHGLLLIQKITPYEFCKEARKNNADSNVQRAILYYNQLSSFVPYMITRKEFGTPEARARLYEFFIDLSMALYKLHDFNSSFALLGGVNMGALDRLKSMHPCVSAQHRKRLKKLNKWLNPNLGFPILRAHIKSIENEPFIPIVMMFTSDLAHLEENKDFKSSDVAPATLLMLAQPLLTLVKTQQNPPKQCQRSDFIDHLKTWCELHKKILSESQDKSQAIDFYLYERAKQLQSPPKP